MTWSFVILPLPLEQWDDNTHSVSEFSAINKSEVSRYQYESKMSKEYTSRTACLKSYRGENIKVIIFQHFLHAEYFTERELIYMLHILQQILKMLFMDTNTCISTMSKWGSDTFENVMCDKNLVYCILYVLPKLFPGASTAGVKYIFIETLKQSLSYEGLVTTVAMIQELWKHDQSSTPNNACITTPIQPE